MSAFTASNGVIVDLHDYGSFKAGIVRTVDNEVTLAGVHTEALREFFRAEEDERIHRWRDPDRPYLLVYQASEGAVVVFNEDLPHLSNEFYRNHFHSAEGPATTSLRLAARAYFQAHPDPWPWHDAKPGEVWALRFEGDDEEFAAVRVDGRWKAAEGGWPNEDLITTGRRIWPEVTS